MKRENLIAYAVSFASFLLDDSVGKDIERILLFGSVARGNFDNESDIDLFIDTKADIEKNVQKVLKLFQNSETQKKWELKGLKNELSIQTGNLNNWKLKRDIITDGVILYGKFNELAETAQHCLMLQTSFSRFKKSQKVRLWRKLYGYKQKIGKKIYSTQGIVEKIEGSRMESAIIIPVKSKKEIIDFLNKEKVNYTLREIWME